MTNKKTKKYKQQESRTVSVAEGKERFSGLMRDAMEEKAEFIITKRGKPVAAIIPYEEYKRSKRVEGYQKIMKAREAFLKSDVHADDVIKESKKQLEKKV